MPLQALAEGLESSLALAEAFPREAERRAFLDSVVVEVDSSQGYMWVSDVDGHVHISGPYLRSAPEIALYLDLCHELIHVKQYREGRELFDRRYKYVDRPTEVEAWRLTVMEARRLHLSEEEISEYLRVEWVPLDDHERLLRVLGVRPRAPG